MPFIKKNNKVQKNNIQIAKNHNLKTKMKTNNIKNKPKKDIIKDKLSSKVSNANHLIIEQIKKLLTKIK